MLLDLEKRVKDRDLYLLKFDKIVMYKTKMRKTQQDIVGITWEQRRIHHTFIQKYTKVYKEKQGHTLRYFIIHKSREDTCS